MDRINTVRHFLLVGVFILALVAGTAGCGGGGESNAGDGGSPFTNPASSAVACSGDGAPAIAGDTFYINPAVGSISNDGSAEHPWSTLQEVIENGLIETRAYADLPYDGSNSLVLKNEGAPVKGGDTLILMGGFHGEFNLRGAYNEYPITIKAADGEVPELSRIFLSSASNWRFDGLHVSPSTAPDYVTHTLVQVESHGWHGPSSNVVVDNCQLYSVEDVSGWDLDQWNALPCNAISVSGDCMTIRNNYCRNVNFGITVSGNNAMVSGNIIENFAGDGMRGLGNDLLFAYNVVKNCYDVNENHDDGFQSWSINDDPPRERVVLRGNTIINYEDPDQPFRGALQGIGCFDGAYVDWVVENNLVVTDHWHGISLYGAINSRIVNNTVVDINDTSPGPPWIRINPHKDGTPSRGCVMRNNIAASIVATGDTLEDHNHLLTVDDDFFAAPDRFDYRLVMHPDSPVIDQGSDLLAPDMDLDMNPRPSDGGVDLGCYEY